MRITFACLIIGSFVALSAKAVEDVEEPQPTITLDTTTAAQGIPISVSVVQAAQVVVLDQDQILSIASDINAAEEAENASAEEEDALLAEQSLDESSEDTSLNQHMNRLSTPFSPSSTASFPSVTSSDFTFSPITLAPESSGIARSPPIKASISASASAPNSKASPSKVLRKKVKSNASSSSSTFSIYWISAIALSIGIMGQYL